MKIRFIFCLFFVLSKCSIAQNTLGIEKNTVQFLLKLYHQNRDQDVLYYTQHLRLDARDERTDSIQYIRSYCLMETGQYQEAAILLNKTNHKHQCDNLLSAFCYAHIGQTDSVFKTLKNVNQNATTELFRASNYLLNYDTTHFDQIIQSNIKKDSSLQSFWLKDMELSHQIPKTKKSALIAGLLSTAVPGLGKIYTGQKKDGLSTFFTLVPLGLLVAENIYRSGIKKPQTIAFSSIFLIFYTGNIIGSIYSPKASYENQQKKFRKEILYHLYLPLRSTCQP